VGLVQFVIRLMLVAGCRKEGVWRRFQRRGDWDAVASLATGRL